MDGVLCLSQTGSSSERMGVLDRIDSMESSEDISGGQGLERINSVCYILLLLPFKGRFSVSVEPGSAGSPWVLLHFGGREPLGISGARLPANQPLVS